MSASIKLPRYKKQFTRDHKLNRNAKLNRAINGGRTAAQGFYLYWGGTNEKRNSRFNCL